MAFCRVLQQLVRRGSAARGRTLQSVQQGFAYATGPSAVGGELSSPGALLRFQKGFATTASGATGMTNEATKVVERPVWQWALAGAGLGGIVYYYQHRTTADQMSGDKTPLKPIEEVPGAAADDKPHDVPDFTLTAAGGGNIGLSDIRGEFVLLAFQPKTDSKGVLEKMSDVILNSDRKSNMQYTKALYVGEASVAKEATPYNSTKQTHLRVKAAYGPDVSKLRSAADKFAKEVGSTAGELYLLSPEGDFAVVYDKHANVADIADSMARIIINYNRQHPQWHYPKATKERHA